MPPSSRRVAARVVAALAAVFWGSSGSALIDLLVVVEQDERFPAKPARVGVGPLHLVLVAGPLVVRSGPAVRTRPCPCPRSWAFRRAVYDAPLAGSTTDAGDITNGVNHFPMQASLAPAGWASWRSPPGRPAGCLPGRRRTPSPGQGTESAGLGPGRREVADLRARWRAMPVSTTRAPPVTVPAGARPWVRWPSSAWSARLESTDPLLRCDSAEPELWFDSTEAADIDDRIDAAEANEPTLPTDANEAALPIESAESWERTDRTEFSDQSDHTSRSVALDGGG